MTAPTTVNDVKGWLDEKITPEIIWAKEHPEPGTLDAISTLKALCGLLAQLGVSDVFTEPRNLLANESKIGEMANRRKQAAIQRLDIARREAQAAADPEAALDELAVVLAETEPWIAQAPGVEARLVVEAGMLARGCVQRASMVAVGESDGVYRRLQTLAAAAVAKVEEAPLPDKVWSSAEPARLTMRSDHPESWTTLLREVDVFVRVHECARLVRTLGGVQQELPGGAPRIAWQYRAWQTALLEQDQIRAIPVALRLRWACEHGWQPGLWFAHEVDGRGDPQPAEPKRRKLLGLGR